MGATGIIGNHIVRELLADGHEVSTFSRGQTPSQNLEGLSVQSVTGDITDLDSLKKAFVGMDWVFQAAAYYPQNMFEKAHHVRVALKGVRNVIETALKTKIKRLIYTSSLTTVGQAKRGTLADETIPYDLVGRDPHPYFLVKHLSEEELRCSCREQGLPVVMVNPTGCFGPYELKKPHLCLVPQLVKKAIPAYVSNRLNVVDVADVGRGHVLAAMKGRIGERYVLGGHNTTTAQVIHEICRLAGVKAPLVRVPISLALSLCSLDEFLSHTFHKNPKLPILGVRFVQYGQHLSIAKAQNELGYQPHDMADCYQKAIGWFRQIGYC
jgi:dihydroflavonol-4-reductase